MNTICIICFAVLTEEEEIGVQTHAMLGSSSKDWLAPELFESNLN